MFYIWSSSLESTIQDNKIVFKKMDYSCKIKKQQILADWCIFLVDASLTDSLHKLTDIY